MRLVLPARPSPTTPITVPFHGVSSIDATIAATSESLEPPPLGSLGCELATVIATSESLEPPPPGSLD